MLPRGNLELFEAMFYYFSAVPLSCNTASEQTRSLSYFFLDLKPDKNLNICSEVQLIVQKISTYMLLSHKL